MQIVIDIPKDVYESIISGNFDTDGYFKMNLRDTFRNGTLLPKGHGDLKDADIMKTMKSIQSGNFNVVGLIRLWIDSQPTIIEADKAESENKE